MAVRELNGTSDDITMSIGGLSAMTYGTVAALVKRLSTTTIDRYFATDDTVGGRCVYCTWTQFGDLTWGEGFNSATLGGFDTSGVWRLIVTRKVTGSAIPRFSIYDYSNTTWSHAVGSAAMNNSATPGSSAVVRFSDLGTNDWANVRIAVRAAWSNTLPWTADATGDTALQNAGLHQSLQQWTAAGPSALWAFNQGSIATAVSDLTGGGANQSSISGTTVITNDDPPSFSFGGNSPPAPILHMTAVGRAANF